MPFNHIQKFIELLIKYSNKTLYFHDIALDNYPINMIVHSATLQAIISVRVLSGIFMLFLVTCNFVLTSTATQSNNNDTNPVLKAIQEALPTNNRYLKA